MGRHGVHGIGHPLEVVGTVLEVADVAWNAYELRREHRHNHHSSAVAAAVEDAKEDGGGEEEELLQLQAENRRLRALLAENLNLLQGLSESSSLSKDCPPDLYVRLLTAVDSSRFLTQLESLHQASTLAPNDSFPFREIAGEDLKLVDVMVNVHGEPSWWVWVTEEMVPGSVEELSGIDKENYVLISDENVVDGIANFMARCIIANPKSKRLTPEELQKTVARALGGINNWSKLEKVWHAGKIIYCLSTWGLALAGLYRHRALVKAAARGIGASGKLIMKAL